ncbi:hypothetical protein ACIFOC_01908 [Leucobacter aridicollis]|uniref:DUF2207 domain-containing protein n=1 Tax=Leucobacter aridicollis TaxID=283878 RepID=UPI0037CB5FE4
MRKFLRTSSLLLAATGLLVAPALVATPALADVDDFTYDAWHVDAEVGVDDAGRAVATVTETISPRFPETDQNRGIVRGIPIDYQRAGTDPRDFTVTDAGGAPVPFEVDDEDGFRIVLVGDDSYVHGPQTYVLSYTISDVVLPRDDGAADEFYWDLLDFEHVQPVARFTAEVSFSDAIAPKLDGNATCYFGAPKSTTECAITGAGTESDPIRIADLPLGPREGVTVAVGLTPGAVVQPPQRLPNFALDGMPLIIGGAGLATAAVGGISVARFRGRRSTGRGTVVPQYDVPTSLPPLLAAPIFGGGTAAPHAAEIIHLAVLGATRLEEDEESGKKKKRKRAQIVRVLDPSRAVDELDARMLQALVPGAEPGAAKAIPKQSTKFAEKMTKLTAAGAAAAVDRGYLEKAYAPGGRAFGYTTLAISAVLFVLGIVGLATRGSALGALFLFGGLLLAAVGVFSVVKHTVHTRLGAETREYLAGVRLFITVAEEDRIKTLQSASGAERREVDGMSVIHLYERLLPYAMLFNLEKEWTKTLQVHYEQHQNYVPYWYPALAVHGLGSFPSTLASYTQSLSSAVSYTSSSSGGSTGGGFAGGGGGGGFSGGR